MSWLPAAPTGSARGLSADNERVTDRVTLPSALPSVLTNGVLAAAATAVAADQQSGSSTPTGRNGLDGGAGSDGTDGRAGTDGNDGTNGTNGVGLTADQTMLLSTRGLITGSFDAGAGVFTWGTTSVPATNATGRPVTGTVPAIAGYAAGKTTLVYVLRVLPS